MKKNTNNAILRNISTIYLQQLTANKTKFVDWQRKIIKSFYTKNLEKMINVIS